jgi:hypothetical protein
VDNGGIWDGLTRLTNALRLKQEVQREHGMYRPLGIGWLNSGKQNGIKSQDNAMKKETGNWKLGYPGRILHDVQGDAAKCGYTPKFWRLHNFDEYSGVPRCESCKGKRNNKN